MIRAFIGVVIGESVAGEIARAQAELGRKLPGIRWVGRDNLHLTLKFLGPIEEPKREPVVRALEETLGSRAAFPILARGLGVFPDIRRAKTVWAGLEGAELKSLASAVEAAMEMAGFAREEREFQPHLTIGRRRRSGARAEADDLEKELRNWKDYEFGESWVNEVVLFQSLLKAEGAVYRRLNAIRLGPS